MYTARLVRDHYVTFYEQAESLQGNQLAGLEAREHALGSRNG
jgi:hypothetical protein